MTEQASLGDISESKNQNSGTDEIKGNWETVKIGNNDYFERYSGDTPTKGNEEYWGGDIKWLSNSEVSDDQVNLVSNTDLQITEEGLNNCTAKIIPENSVILSCTASIGKVAINNDEMATNQQFNAFEIKKGFNPYFLANQLFYRGGELQAMGGSTTHNHIAVYVLEKFDLNKPPIDEQRRIASVLYNVDQAIQKTEEIIEQTQRVKKGLMQDLFTEGYYTHEEFEEDTFGEYPANWKKKKLSEILKKGPQNGLYKSSDNYGSGEAIIELPDIYEADKILAHNNFRKLDVSDSELEKYGVENGDIIVNRVSKQVSGVGKTLRVDFDGRAVFESNMMRMRLDKDQVMTRFFLYATRSTRYRKYIAAVAKHSNQASIDQSSLENFSIVIPSIEEQQEICRVLDSLDSKKKNLKEKKEQLQRLKKGLMQDLLTGSVRTGEDVRVLDEVVEVEG